MTKLLTGILGISLLLNGWLVYRYAYQKPVDSPEKAETEQYPFLARRIFIENPNDIIINFLELRYDLREYAQRLDGNIGIYFEYLPTGSHIGINDRQTFRRASLVKIPIVMQVYQGIETGKITKEDELTLTKELVDSRYGDLWKRGEGTKIRVDEAIKLALIESDNTAINLLQDKVDKINGIKSGSDNTINYVYDYLDIERENEGKTLDISARGFASMLKSLYHSAYLSFASSNEILTIMTRTITPYRLLPEGVEDHILIAHKYGVNRDGSGKNLVTSDCGIIYYPKRPYILCVMAAEVPEKASKYISDISKIVFDYMSAVNTKR